MHLLVSVAVVGVLYLGLFHTSINRWVVVIGAVVASNIGHIAVGTSVGALGLFLEYAVGFVVVAVGLAKRRFDAAAESLDDLQADPTAIRSDAIAVTDQLGSQGFEPAPEGWLHFDRFDWDALAMRRGPVNAFTVSSDRGPLTELVSLFDDHLVLQTVSRARDRVAPQVLRQCFPDADLDTLVREHEQSLEWIRRNGRVAREIPRDELTEHMLTGERRSAPHTRRGAAGSVVRELRRQHLDLGTIVRRPDAVSALRPRR